MSCSTSSYTGQFHFDLIFILYDQRVLCMKTLLLSPSATNFIPLYRFFLSKPECTLLMNCMREVAKKFRVSACKTKLLAKRLLESVPPGSLARRANPLAPRFSLCVSFVRLSSSWPSSLESASATIPMQTVPPFSFTTR